MELETIETLHPVCPWCGEEQTGNDEDYEDEEWVVCEKCKQEFVIHRQQVWIYSTCR